VTTGASGVPRFWPPLKRWGFAEAVKAKAKPAANGDQVNANHPQTARRDLAVLPISEILRSRGRNWAASSLGVQTYVVMVAGANANARSAVARDFVTYLMSGATSGVNPRQGHGTLDRNGRNPSRC
jgi:hypothetical protein